MINFKILVLVAICLIPLFITPVFAELTTDKANYSTGETVIISGVAPSGVVEYTFELIDPDGESMAIGQFELWEEREYSFHIPVGGQLWTDSGIFTVTITYDNGKKDQTTFGFEMLEDSTPRSTLPPACVGCEGDAEIAAEMAMLKEVPVSVWTDKTTYDHESTIRVDGAVEDIRTGTLVKITVISPTNNIVTIDQLTVDSNGRFSITLSTQGSLWKYDGTYTIRAQYGNQAVGNKALVELTGGMTPSFVTPVSTLSPEDCGPNQVFQNNQCLDIDSSSGSYTINIPTGAADPNAPYFWQSEKNGSTTGNITILTGDTVKWTNADTAFHTVTSGSPSNGPDGIFDSDLFSPGGSFSYKFSQEGIFPYFCMIHPWMVGTVIVEVESTFSVIQNVGDDAGDGSTTFDVEYEFNRVIADATVDEKQKSITFTLVGKPQNNDNTLTLYLSKDLISNPNVVWADGKSVTDFEVISEGGINVVTIPVTETTEQVTILGGSVVTQPESEPTPEPVEEPEPTPKPKSIPEPTPAPTPAPTPTQNDDLSEVIEENKKLREELERQGEQIDAINQEVDLLKQIIQSIQNFFSSIFG